MAQQVLQHASAPVAPEFVTATRRHGYSDLVGYHTIGHGGVFIGWVDPPPLSGQEPGTIAASLEYGEAVVTFHLRADLGSSGIGMIAFLASAEGALGRPTHVEVAKGGTVTSALSGGTI